MRKLRLVRIEALLALRECHRRSRPRPLKTVQDVIALLEEQAQAVRSDPWTGTVEKARALAYLAGVARRTIETGVLADRLEILETILHQRKAPRTQGTPMIQRRKEGQ